VSLAVAIDRRRSVLVKPVQPNQPVPTVLDDLSPLARVFVNLVSLVSLARELLDASSSSDTSDEFSIQASPPDWPHELEPYFLPHSPERKRPQMRRSNPGEAAARDNLQQLLQTELPAIKAAFLGRIHVNDGILEFEGSPFYIFEVIMKSIMRPQPFSDAIKSASFSFIKDPSYNTKAQFNLKALNFTASNQKIGKQNTELIDRNMNLVASAMVNWAGYMGNERPYLKELPGLTASMGDAWSRRHSRTEDSLKNSSNISGLIQVVREARGAITSDREDTNLIVRDLLWIRPFQANIGEQPVYDDMYGKRMGSQHGSPIGFYYSVIDGVVYEIKRLSVRSNVVMLEALALFDDPLVSKSLTLHLPSFDDSSLNFSMGSLMGATTRQKRNGAWTIIAIRPDLSPEEEDQIDLHLGIYADTFLEIDRDTYNSSIVGLKKYFDRLRLGGVLSSDFLINSVAFLSREKHVFAVEAHQEFRRVFRTVKEYRENCVRYRDKLMEEIRSIKDESRRDLRMREVLLDLIEQQSSFAICPVSTTKTDLRPEEAARIRRSAEKLSKRSEQIFPDHQAYRVWCEAINPIDRSTT